MSYQVSTYSGDEKYSINCTGDACVGDHLCFERATFTGSFRNAKFVGFERIEAEIVADSYGESKQQHTFTLELSDGSTLLMKGRNLYREGCWRKLWNDEAERRAALAEKHSRGDEARAIRVERRMYA